MPTIRMKPVRRPPGGVGDAQQHLHHEGHFGPLLFGERIRSFYIRMEPGENHEAVRFAREHSPDFDQVLALRCG